MYKSIARLFMIILKVIRILFKSKHDLLTDNLALRQQLAAFKAKKIKPKISDTDRSFWIALRKVWVNWSDALIIVKPKTVIDWQRRRFKNYWWMAFMQTTAISIPPSMRSQPGRENSLI